MVDMIYADVYGRELGMLPWFEGEFSDGIQNSFSVKVPPELGIDEYWYLMIPETGFGGIVDDMDIDTSKKYATVLGRTWRGMLQSNVIEPDAGKTHYICTGDVNRMIDALISRMGLSGRMMADRNNAGITVTGYGIRNECGHDAICGMLRSVGAKLQIRYDGKERKAVLSGVPRCDYTDNGIDGDSQKFRIKTTHPANHYIGLGKGEGTARIVVHRYMDANGNISNTQSLFGVKHICEKYDSPSSESKDLIEAVDKRLKEGYAKKSSCTLIGATSGDYDIGDIVGGRSTRHKRSVVTEIAQKIATVTPKSIRCETKTKQEV